MNYLPKHVHEQVEADRQQQRAALWSATTVMMCAFLFLAPQLLPSKLVLAVLGVVPALAVTTFLFTQPESLRNRSGSLSTAIQLVTYLWIVAIGCIIGLATDIVQ